MNVTLPSFVTSFVLLASIALGSPAALAGHDMTCHPPRPGVFDLGTFTHSNYLASGGPVIQIHVRLAGGDDWAAHGSIVFVPDGLREHATVLVVDGATDASCAYVDGWPRLIEVTLLLFDARTHERLAAYVIADSGADLTGAYDAWLHVDADSAPIAVTVGPTVPAAPPGQPGQPGDPDR